MNVCTICARGGSKGVKNKNLRMVNGLPLIAHTVRQALKSKIFDVVAVSSDSKDILKAAEEAGAHILIERPDELATDSAAKLPVIKHALLSVEKIKNATAKTLIDLDCTSPLRNTDDIIGVFNLLSKAEVKNVITGSHARRSPYFNLVEKQANGSVGLVKTLPSSIVRRQDAPVCYDMNASIYGWRRDELINSEKVIQEGTYLYEMPEERSLDIDSELDFKLVNFLMCERNDL